MQGSSQAAVFVFALVALASAPLRAQSAVPALRLVWFDAAEIASGGELLACAEAAKVLGRMEVPVSWRRAAPGELMRADELWVVLVAAGPETRAGARVLGSTRVRASGTRVVWVRVASVRAAVGVAGDGPLDRLPRAERERVGRALGRVIAHEVVHALVPTLPHGVGLMADVLTRRQLTEATLLIAPAVARSVRLALQREAAVPQRTAVLYAHGTSPGGRTEPEHLHDRRSAGSR